MGEGRGERGTRFERKPAGPHPARWHKNLCCSTNSEKSWIICEYNICIKEFYLDHLHQESHLIFKKKPFVKLCQPTLFNSFSRTIARAQLKGVVPIGRRALNQGTLIKTNNLYWFGCRWSLKVVDEEAKKQVFFLSKKVKVKDLGLGEGRGAGLIRGRCLKRNKTRFCAMDTFYKLWVINLVSGAFIIIWFRNSSSLLGKLVTRFFFKYNR